MPPRTNTRFVLNNNVTPNQPVGAFLAKEIFRMKKQLNEELNCTICIEDICCDKCYCVLLCGHNFHYVCVSAESICPLCRK